MGDTAIKWRSKVRPKAERLTTTRHGEFIVTVLKAEFRMSEDQAYRVMITAHRLDHVSSLSNEDVAETKATRATEAGRSKGYPLQFTTEPEE